MKIGDILYCKKYFFNNCHFLPNDKFEVIDISDDYTLLKTKLNLTISMINIKNNHIFLNKNRYIWDYLQTEKEYRKEKLEKINKLNNNVFKYLKIVPKNSYDEGRCVKCAASSFCGSTYFECKCNLNQSYIIDVKKERKDKIEKINNENNL